MNPVRYSLTTATAIVIASMIGTGVFTSLYFQVESLPSGAALLLLWLAGGLVALCGGLCYAELAGLFPRSGGEYEYLTKIYHPALGFSAGICTLIVGFAAPMAGISLNLGNYFAPILHIQPDSMATRMVALMAVVFVMFIHLWNPVFGNKFQNISTIFKLVLIAVFIILPFLLPHFKPSKVSFSVNAQTFDLVFSGNFFSCLALLYYTYTGWNTSIYMSSDIENPHKNLPLSILIGVVVVTGIYLILNFIFLYISDFQEITNGGSSIGNTVVAKLFGNATFIGTPVLYIFSALLSLALLATLNAYMIASYRVAEVLGKDFAIFSIFSQTSKTNAPHWAILSVGVVTMLFVLVSDIKSLLDYIGFALSIFASLVVFGIFIMRWRAPAALRPFRAWGYPVTPLVFLGINAAMIYYSVQTHVWR
jgi:basic amino acid/polyamine antiporter, APA family